MKNDTVVFADQGLMEAEILVSAAIAQMRFLQGKVLTVIDSALPAGQQNKAVKDTIKIVFGQQMDHMFEMATHTQGMRISGKSQLQGSDCEPGAKAEVMSTGDYEEITTPDDFKQE